MDGVKKCKHGRNFCCECHKAGDLSPAREAMRPENQRIYQVGTTRDYESELAALREELADREADVRAHAGRRVAAEQRNVDTIAKLELAASMMDDDERGNRFAEVCRLAIKSLKPTESGASE